MFRRFALLTGFTCFFILMAAIGTSYAQSSNAENKSYEFGVSAGVWFSGDETLTWGDHSVTVTKTNSFLMKGFLDAYAGQYVAIGLYGNFAPSVGYNDTSATQSMYEFGLAVKPRFVFSNVIAVKPGLGIGYRRYSSSNSSYNDMQAMGANMSVEIQYIALGKVIPYIEFGFLAQPVGGNADFGLKFAPVWYVMGGVAF